MPFVDSNGAKLFWDQAGDGTPILLIMGHTYSSKMWYPLLPEIADHHAIWFDNRGTGESDTTSGTKIAQFAADALAVLDAAEVDKAHVYGVSMGGGIAAEFAMLYPERVKSLTLGCTTIKSEKSELKGLGALIYNLPHFVVRWIMNRAMKPENYGSAAPTDRALADMEMLRQDKFTMQGVRTQAQAIADYHTTHERAIAALTMPILILHGDEDKAVPVEKGRLMAEIFPHAKYVEFKGSGHNYLVCYHAESTAAFREFIAEVDAAA